MLPKNYWETKPLWLQRKIS